MSDGYEDTLQALRREIEIGGGRPAVIDTLVGSLLSAESEMIVVDLLSLLSDKASNDEGIFSIIHAAESFDDSRYVRDLLSIFPDLASSSPRWASIVLMRVLNNRKTQLEVVRQLRDAPSVVKSWMRDMCDRINEVSPQFLSKTMPVSLAAM